MLVQSDFWEHLLQPQNAAILVPITAIFASFWYAAVRIRSRNTLKQSMVERGMSADEIVRVLKA